MHSAQSLYSELVRTDVMIRAQIEQVKRLAQEDFNDLDPHLLQDSSGGYLLSPLLVARANILAGMASLKSSELKDKKR